MMNPLVHPRNFNTSTPPVKHEFFPCAILLDQPFGQPAVGTGPTIVAFRGRLAILTSYVAGAQDYPVPQS